MLLEGITVVDLYPNLASSYASRLFSDLGATVIMLEPANGSDVRHMEPKFAPDDESVYHSYLNQNKHAALSSVGSYKIEENKRHNFIDIKEGDLETILGFPLKGFLKKFKSEVI